MKFTPTQNSIYKIPYNGYYLGWTGWKSSGGVSAGQWIAVRESDCLRLQKGAQLRTDDMGALGDERKDEALKDVMKMVDDYAEQPKPKWMQRNDILYAHLGRLTDIENTLNRALSDIKEFKEYMDWTNQLENQDDGVTRTHLSDENT